MTDPARLAGVRAALVDDALEDYVGMSRVLSWARKLTGQGFAVDPTVLRNAVTELLTSLVGHESVLVTTGYLDQEYTDVAVLREAIEAGWADHDGHLIDGDVAWVAGRRYERLPALRPGERPACRDAPSFPVDDIDEALARSRESDLALRRAREAEGPA